MSDIHFVIGDGNEGPVEVYATVNAVDQIAAIEALRAEIQELVGDRTGIEILLEGGHVSRLLVAINTSRIAEEDVVQVDKDDGLEWNGEEVTMAPAPAPEDYTEEREVAEAGELPSSERFTLLIRERQNAWQSRHVGRLRFGIGAKGGVSVYGLNRYPVTLYYEQWIKLLSVADELRKFMEDNNSKLKKKSA